MVTDLRIPYSTFMTALLLLLSATIALAQDAHYWDAQYGTRSQLLGGLVVGAPNDLSTTFYNPAWLALEDQPSVLLTTKTFEAYTLKVENGFGNGTEPTSTKVTPSPGFFGAKFSTNLNNDKVAVAFSYLQKVKFDYNASGVRVDSDAAPPTDGNFWFSGEAYKVTAVSEYWAGVTFAKRIGDNVYAGVTPFGALRNQSYRSQISAKGMDSEENFSHAYSMHNADFWHTRLLLKAGLAFDYSPLTFGFTLTTPSIGLFGDGTAHQDGSLSGIDAFDPAGSPDTFLAVDYQPGLNPTYKSPFSMAAGAAYQFGNTGIYFSAEWFNTVGKYNLLSPGSFSSQSHPDQVFSYDISSSTRSIFNWGLAGSHQFSPRFALYGSFWMDKSNLKPGEDPNMMMAFWDLTHLNLGASFDFLNIEFTSGLGYSHGQGTSDHFQSFNSEVNGNVEGSFPATDVTFNRLTFLIGFNLPLGSVEN